VILGERIRELREARSLSQRELARRAGVDHSYVSKIENGRTEVPSVDTLRALATVLEVEEVEMLGFADVLPGAFASIARSPEAMRFMRRASDLARSSEDWVEMLEVLEVRMAAQGKVGIGDRDRRTGGAQSARDARDEPRARGRGR
jgi:transcriptional regulator with XRE-family HTH domain